jgi:ribosomal protein S18 acetylase RimI-like enzyme
MSAVRAWPAEPHEAETVARLLVEFRDHMAKDWPSGNAILAAVERLVEDPQTEYLLAAPDEDSPPAGVVQLRYRLSVWTAAPDCWLEDLFVSESARRSGCGEALVALAFERAALRGCRRIELDTTEDNAPALALYERMGFSDRSKGPRSLFLGRPIEPAR